MLAYLADAGSRVRFVPLAGASSDSIILGPLEVLATRSRLDESGVVQADSVQDLVRPYATRLRLACLDAESVCASPLALVASPTQAGGSVVRLVGPSGPGIPPMLVVNHEPIPGSADSVPSTIAVVGRRRPDGAGETILERAGVAGCMTLRLGEAGFDATASGSVFSAGGEDCGPAGRIVRLDGALGDRPVLSRLGGTTMAAEDRIRRPLEIEAARDGMRILVREEEAVWLLDRDLRVLGFRAVSPRARIAWVVPGGVAAPRFVIADEGRLEIYEADRFGLERAVPVGPLAGAPLVAVSVAGVGVVAAFVPAGGPESIVTVELGR
jgi:hypothetical protein